MIELSTITKRRSDCRSPQAGESTEVATSDDELAGLSAGEFSVEEFIESGEEDTFCRSKEIAGPKKEPILSF